MAATKKSAGMTPAHKAALERGRREGRIVRGYLTALRVNKPRPGRKRTEATAKRQLAETVKQLADGVANPAAELALIQRKLDLKTEIRALSAPKKDMKALEEAFVKVAASYGRRRGITRAAWRAVGVPPNVLKRAGIK